MKIPFIFFCISVLLTQQDLSGCELDLPKQLRKNETLSCGHKDKNPKYQYTVPDFPAIEKRYKLEQEKKEKIRLAWERFGWQRALRSAGSGSHYGEGSLDFDSREIPDFNKKDIKLLQLIDKLVFVRLFGDMVDDAAISILTTAPPHNVRSVEIVSNKITDKSIEALKKIPRLERLYIASHSISDKGLEEISKIQSLKVLTIQSDNITGNGLASISKLQALCRVSLYGKNITLEDAKRLFLALPNLNCFQFPSICAGAGSPGYYMYGSE